MASPRRRRGCFATLLRLALRFALVLLVVVVGLLLGLTLYLRSDAFQQLARAWLVQVVEAETGERFDLERVDVALWPPGVSASGVVLASAENGDDIVRVERLDAPLSIARLRPRIGTLTLLRPQLFLHVDADGLRELRNRKRREGAGLAELPFDALEVVDAAARIALPDGEVQVDDLDITPIGGHVANATTTVTVTFRDLHDSARLALPRVSIGPDRIVVPRVDLQSRILGLRGRLDVPLKGPIEADLSGSVDPAPLNVLLAPPRQVEGWLDLDLRVTGTPADPKVEGVLLATDATFHAPGVFKPELVYRFGNLVAVVEATREGIDIERAVLDTGEGRFTVSGHVTPDLQLERAIVHGEAVSLEHLLRRFDAAPTPWVDWTADAEIELSGSLKPLHLSGPFELAVADFHVGDRPISNPQVEVMLDLPRGTARGTMDLFQDHVELHAAHVTGPRSTGRAEVSIGFGPYGPLDIRADLYDADMRDFQPLGTSRLRGTGRVTGRIHGDLGSLVVEGEGSLDGFSVAGIDYADHLDSPIRSDLKVLWLDDARARLGSTLYKGSFSMDFKHELFMETDVMITDGRVEDIVGLFIDLPGLTGHVEGTLQLRGRPFDLDGESHLVASDMSLWGERFEHGEGHGYMDDGAFTLDDLRLWRHAGDEGLVMRGSVEREYALNMEVVGDGLDLASLDWLAPAEVPVSGRVGLVAHIGNTIMDPAPRGRIDITDVRWAGRPLPDSVARFHTEDAVLHYAGGVFGEAVRYAGTLELWNEQRYALAADLADFPLHLVYPVAADGGDVKGALSGKLVVSGDFGEEFSPVDLELDVERSTLAWAGHTLSNPRKWRYEQHGNRLHLVGFQLVGGATRLGLDLLSDEGALDVAGDGVFDMDLLRAVVPGLTRADGLGTVAVRAEGKAPDVASVVDVTLDGSIVRHSAFPGTFEDLEAHVFGTQSGYTLDGVTATLGGGEVVGGGTIAAKAWMPTRYDLSLTATDAQVKWADYLPPAAGDATLRFDGPADGLLLSGEVGIREMRFADRIDWEDWVVEVGDTLLVDAASLEESTPYFDFDIRVLADHTIRLENNVADGVASADLRVLGDTAMPGLGGTVRVDEGIAILQDREFRIDRGEILFRDPFAWDPDLDFELTSDIQSRDQLYRVDYLVRGPYSAWETYTRSDPPLPQADVNALLWFGVTTQELEDMGELGTALAAGAVDLLVTDLALSNRGTSQLLDEFRIERIELATGVNARGDYQTEPRLLLGGTIDPLGELTFEWNPQLTDDYYIRLERPLPLPGDVRGSLWHAGRQRERNLPIGGAYGIDIRARWEWDF